MFKTKRDVDRYVSSILYRIWDEKELCIKYEIEKEKIKKENELAISSCLNKVDSDEFTVQYINDDIEHSTSSEDGDNSRNENEAYQINESNERDKNSRGVQFAKLYYDVSEYKSAKEYLQKYLNVHETSPQAYKLMGQILEAQKDQKQALGAYQRCVELDLKQKEVILKVCELYCDSSIEVDADNANLWIERAERYYPNNNIVYGLKEKVLHPNATGDIQDLLHLINEELVKNPADVHLHIKLLRLYTQSGQLKQAYEHVIETESMLTFTSSVEWYNALLDMFQVYQDQYGGTDNDTFFTHKLFTMAMLVLLRLQSEECDIYSAVKILHMLDQDLYLANKGHRDTKEWNRFLAEMNGQLFYLLALLLLKRALKGQMFWEDASSYSAVCFLLSNSMVPIDLQSSWYQQAKPDRKRFYDYLYNAGCDRLSQGGHMIYSILSKQEGDKQWARKLRQKLCTVQGKNRLHTVIFTWELYHRKDSSYIMQSDIFTETNLEVPAKSLLKKYDAVAYSLHRKDLNHLVWLAMQYYVSNDDVQPDYEQIFGYQLYPDMKYSMPDLSASDPSTLCQLDVQVFLYASVIWAIIKDGEQKRKLRTIPDKPDLLPEYFSVPYCNAQQIEWWSAVFYMETKAASENSAKLWGLVMCGLETIRLVVPDMLSLQLVVHVAMTLDARAKEMQSFDMEGIVTPKLTAILHRATFYWKRAAEMIHRVKRNQIVTMPKEMIFPSSHLTDPALIKKLKDQVKFAMATVAMRNHNYEEALGKFTDLSNPEAAYNSGLIYRKMAEEVHDSDQNLSISVDYDQQMALLTNSKSALFKALDRLEIDRNEELKEAVKQDLEDVLSKLMSLELRDTQTDGVLSPEKSEEESEVQEKQRISPTHLHVQLKEQEVTNLEMLSRKSTLEESMRTNKKMMQEIFNQLRECRDENRSLHDQIQILSVQRLSGVTVCREQGIPPPTPGVNTMTMSFERGPEYKLTVPPHLLHYDISASVGSGSRPGDEFTQENYDDPYNYDSGQYYKPDETEHYMLDQNLEQNRPFVQRAGVEDTSTIRYFPQPHVQGSNPMNAGTLANVPSKSSFQNDTRGTLSVSQQSPPAQLLGPKYFSQNSQAAQPGGIQTPVGMQEKLVADFQPTASSPMVVTKASGSTTSNSKLSAPMMLPNAVITNNQSSEARPVLIPASVGISLSASQSQTTTTALGISAQPSSVSSSISAKYQDDKNDVPPPQLSGHTPKKIPSIPQSLGPASIPLSLDPASIPQPLGTASIPQSLSPSLIPQSLGPTSIAQSLGTASISQSLCPASIPWSSAPAPIPQSLGVASVPWSLSAASVPQSLGSASISQSINLASIPQSLGPVSIPQSLGAASISHSLGPASIPQSFGTASIPLPLGPASIPQPLGTASIPQSLGPSLIPQSLAPTSIAQSLGAASVSQSLGPASIPRSPGPAPIPQSLGAASVSQSLGSASISQSISLSSIPQSLGPASIPQPLGTASIPQSLGPSLTPQSLAPTSITQLLGAASIPQSLGPASIPLSPGPAPISQSLGAASVPWSLSAASVPQSLGSASIPQSIGLASIPQSLCAASIPQSFAPTSITQSHGATSIPQSPGAASIPQSLSPASIPHSLGAASVPQSPGPASIPQSFGYASISQSLCSVSIQQSLGPASVPQSLDAASISHSLVPASIPQSLGTVSIPLSLGSASIPQSLGHASIPQAFGCASIPQSLFPASIPLSLGSASIPQSLGHASIPQAFGCASIPQSLFPASILQSFVHASIPQSLGPASILQSFGPESIPQSLGSASIPQSLGPVLIPQSLGHASISHSLGPASIPQSLGTVSIPLSLGSASIPQSLGHASIPQAFGCASIPQSLFPASIPLSLGSASIPQSLGHASIPQAFGCASIPQSIFPASILQSLVHASIPQSLGPASILQSFGPESIPQSLGSASIPQSLGPVLIPQSLGHASISHSLGPALIPQSLGTVSIPLSLGSASIPQSLGHASIPQSFGCASIPHSLFPASILQSFVHASIPQSLGPASILQSFGPESIPQSLGSASIPQSLGHASIPQSLCAASIPQSLGPTLIPQSLGPALIAQSLGHASIPQSLGPASIPQSLGPASIPQSFGCASIPQSLDPASIPQSLSSASISHSLGHASIAQLLDSAAIPQSLGPASILQSFGAASIPQSLGHASIPQSLVPASIPQSLGPASILQSLGPTSKPQSLCAASISQSLCPALIPQSLAPTSIPQSLGSASIAQSLGPASKPQSLFPASIPQSLDLKPDEIPTHFSLEKVRRKYYNKKLHATHSSTSSMTTEEGFKFTFAPAMDVNIPKPVATLGSGFHFSLCMTPLIKTGMQSPSKLHSVTSHNNTYSTSVISPDESDYSCYENKGNKCNVHFELEKVEWKTGEEDEEVLFSHRAKLYGLLNGEWKEHGIGDVRVLYHKESKKSRIVMRREHILKLCCNHYIVPGLNIKPMSNTKDLTLVWSALVYVDGKPNTEHFSIKFETEQIAKMFVSAIEVAKAKLKGEISFKSPEVETISTISAINKESGKEVQNAELDLKKMAEASESDVMIVKVETASDDEVAKARALMLPDNFYLYTSKPPCLGYLGCEDREHICQTNKEDQDYENDTGDNNDDYSDGQLKTECYHDDHMNNVDKGSSEMAMCPWMVRQVFGGADVQVDELGQNYDDIHVQHGNDLPYEPVVPLPNLTEVVTGEEDETVEFCQKSKLFRFDKDCNQWKEKGIGDMKILKHNDTGTYRLLFRREAVHKLSCNHRLTADVHMHPLTTSEMSWCWTAHDFSENELKVETLAVKFKNIELSRSFSDKIDKIQEQLRKHD